MVSIRPIDGLRAVFAVLLVLAAVPVVDAYRSDQQSLAVAPGATDAAARAGNGSTDVATVVTIDGVGTGQLLAYDERGRLTYLNRTYPVYHDVDPSPAGRSTVLYVANQFDTPGSPCAGNDSCINNVVERVNLTTGEVTRLHGMVDSQEGSASIHDVDRVNDSVLLVGGIDFPDRVYMVNTTTDRIIWQWRVSRAFAPSSGGKYPGDWTHLNDVAMLRDGRVMVNLRNQDQVVFVKPGKGIQESWTLGADDSYGIMFEQHNPDYIPRSRGGPALLVADSENNRVVEYQRENGEWVRSWVWRDARMQWPRDADRLPNGNTLIVDTHGNRVLEVTPGGEIAAVRTLPDGTYDVERLDTGDESTTGWSTAAIRDGRAPTAASGGPGAGGGPGAAPDTATAESAAGRVGALDHATLLVTSVVPPRVLHGLLYALPGWVDALAAVSLVVGAVVALAWAGVEAMCVRRRRGWGLPGSLRR